MTVLKKGSRGNEVKVLQGILHLQQDGIFGPLTEEAVKEFQKLNSLKIDGIVGDATWEKLTNGSLLKTSKRTINEIIVHCSATKEGINYTTSQIKQWHLARGFSDIGYHYVIYLDGSIHNGRDVNISGAHCEGHNTHSIGVCYIGGLDKTGKPKDTRNNKQKESLIRLLTQLKAKYPKATIHGHCEYANKACPCFNARDEYRSISNSLK